jgi:SPP1 family predicted phage head-tail adaptor
MLLSKRPTNPGDLRTQVTLQSPSAAADSGGAQSLTWSNQGTAWAKWINAHGPESIQDGALQAQKRATVTIRYNASLTTSWALLKGSDRYEILSVDDIQERHEYMELQVRQMKGTA